MQGSDAAKLEDVLFGDPQLRGWTVGEKGGHSKFRTVVSAGDGVEGRQRKDLAGSIEVGGHLMSVCLSAILDIAQIRVGHYSLYAVCFQQDCKTNEQKRHQNKEDI